MKSYILALLLLLPLVATAQQSGIIVQFGNNISSDDIQDQIFQTTGQQLTFERNLSLENFTLFSLPSQVPIDTIIDALRQLDGVQSVDKDKTYTYNFTPNDTRYNEQWHYYESIGGLGANEAWDVTKGAGSVIAVIDTGYVFHSDLDSNIIGGYDFVSNVTNANDGDGRDGDYSDPGDWSSWFTCGGFAFPRNSSWHGTHVAGTIAATTNNGDGVAGVAHEGKIIVARVLGRCGGSLSDIIDAVVWSSGGTVPGVPTNTNPAQVINLSLGGSGACATAEQAAIDTAVANGTTVVIAAGNSNDDASNSSPANCANVITVAANDRQGNRASYSNFGSIIDVTAPGGETSTTSNGVLSTLNTGSQGPQSETYAFYQGTSMATPHVAGAVALLYSAEPTMTPAHAEQTLKDTARPLPGSCTGGCGAGIVDLPEALASLGPPPPPVPNEPPVASFTSVVTDLDVSFTDTSTDSDGNVTGWDWDFGDGNTSTQQNPNHAYANEGTYTVCLVVTDDDSDISSQVCNDVSPTDPPPPPPNVEPSANFTSSVNDLTVSFTDTSTDSDGNVTGWDWDFGDGNTSTQQNPNHAYANEGTYTVRLTVTDDDSATDFVEKSVNPTEPDPEPECDFIIFGICFNF